jgi:hypothetical protein
VEFVFSRRTDRHCPLVRLPNAGEVMPRKTEPAAVAAGFTAATNAVVLFADLNLSADQQASIVVVLTLIAGLFIRSKVTPVA